MDSNVIATELDDQAIEVALAAAMKRKLDRLAKAQAPCWNGMTREAQLAYLMEVDRLEAKRG